MDQRERGGNLEEAVRAAIVGYLSSVWTAIPGIVQSVNLQKPTCTVQPTVKAYVRQSDGSQIWVQLPILLDVPIVFPCAGQFALTLPLAPNDEVLVIFSSRCIDAWWQLGGIQIQSELRMHDLSDGFAIPGPRSVPNALINISATTAQLRSKDGSTYVEVAGGQIVNIVAPGGINITGPLTVDGTVGITGTTSIDGNVSVTGAVAASEDGTFEGISVHNHEHTGVTPGSGVSGPPFG